jgi:putative hydrolase of the HAD superfamily
MYLAIDIDGVLLSAHESFRSEMLADTAWNGDVEQFHERLFRDEDYILSLAGELNFRKVLDKLLREFNFPCEANRFMKWWCHELIPNMKLINWIKESSFTKVVLASNQERIRSEAISKNLEPYDFYENIYYSCDIGFVKPDQKYFGFIMNQLDCSPEELLFIDDSSPNVESARELGIHSVQYRSPEQAILEARKVGPV